MNESSKRDIPGMVPVPGRKFVYVLATPDQDLDGVFASIQAFGRINIEKEKRPKSGALLDEQISLVTPNRCKFYGFSFRGDLEGWQRILQEYASLHKLKLAEIRNNLLYIDDGTSYPLEKCDIFIVIQKNEN